LSGSINEQDAHDLAVKKKAVKKAVKKATKKKK
jgi:hypothetical protein